MVATSQEKFGAFVASLSPVTPASADSIPLVRNRITYRVPATAIVPVPPYAVADITRYGGVGDGVTDNTAAWNSAKAASKIIFFPPGRYRFDSPISYTFAQDTDSVSIIGSGADVTELTWPSSVGTALAITLVGLGNSFHIRDLTFTTGTINLDIGVSILQTKGFSSVVASGYAQSDFSNVTFRSNQGYYEEGAGPTITHYWNLAVRMENVSNVNFIGLNVGGPAGAAGDGVFLTGSSPDVIPVQFNFMGCIFFFLSRGIIYGNFVEGIMIALSNFICTTGIDVPLGVTNLDQLSVTGSQFNCGHAVRIRSVLPLVGVSNCAFVVQGSCIGIESTVQTDAMNVTCNMFQGTAGSSVGMSINTSVTTDAVPAVISGNTFFGLTTAVLLGTGTAGAVVLGNIYSGNGANVTNNGTGNHVGVAVP